MDGVPSSLRAVSSAYQSDFRVALHPIEAFKYKLAYSPATTLSLFVYFQGRLLLGNYRLIRR